MSADTNNAGRKLSWDWYADTIPKNVTLDESAYIETSYSFLLYRSKLPEGVRMGKGSTTYLGTMFDLGPEARVHIGDYCCVHGAWFICDSEITVGDYAMISWNVVFMDTYGVSTDPEERRKQLEALPLDGRRRMPRGAPAKPIHIGRNVWIGFDCIVLPGVTIGDGSIVGARSVVTEDVPAFTMVAGNPARLIRKLENDEPNPNSQAR
jgi:acetyltransferase-like isoleucine patch superfamily enzyme